MSRSYKKVPILDLTPGRKFKKYVKTSFNKKYRKLLKNYDDTFIKSGKSNYHNKVVDSSVHDVLNKGYVEIEYYEIFGGKNKLQRK